MNIMQYYEMIKGEMMNYEAMLELLYEIRADIDKRHLGAATRNVNKLVTHCQHKVIIREREEREEGK